MSRNLRRLSRLVNGNYSKVLSTAVKFNPHLKDSVFNYRRVQHCGKGMKSFEGYQSCGAFSYILSPYVQKMLPTNVELGCTMLGYGRHKEDHVFLKAKVHEKDIIIDPTYRQFLIHPVCDGTSDYSKYMFEKLPPFFVGSKQDLEREVDTLISLDKENYAKKDDIMFWWEENTSSPFKLDIIDCLEDSDLYEKKSDSLKIVIDETRKDFIYS